jgi:hypothetical protein
VPPPHRSCFPMISVDKQTPPCIPAKADGASTGWNSPISKRRRRKHNRPPNSTVTSPGDPRGVYLQQGPDVLTRTSLTGCVFRDSALLVSQLQKRGCKALTDHTRLRTRCSPRGFRRGIQHQPDRPGESASCDAANDAFHCSAEVPVVP